MFVANLIAESKSWVPSRAYRISCRLIISLPFGHLGPRLARLSLPRRLAPRPQTCQSSKRRPKRVAPSGRPCSGSTFRSTHDSRTNRHQIVSPSLRLTLAEALVRPAPKLQTDDIMAAATRGDGHSILVLPALARGDP